MKNAIRPQHWYYHSSLWHWRLIWVSATLLIKKKSWHSSSLLHMDIRQEVVLGLGELKKSKLMWLTVHCLSRKYSRYWTSLRLNIRILNNTLLTLRTGCLKEISRILAKYRFAYKYPSPLHTLFLSSFIIHAAFIYLFSHAYDQTFPMFIFPGLESKLG